MKVALLTTDNREYFHDFDNPVPYFGTAPEALLQGFGELPDVEVHVVSCAQRELHAPEKLAHNIWFHSLRVPKIGWLRTGYQGCIRAVRRCLTKIDPDIVHGQGTERDCAICAVFSGFPNVVTVHGNMRLVAKITASPPFSYNWLMGQLEKISLPRSYGVICITRYTQQAVRDLTDRTWLIPNAVDNSFFQIVRGEKSPPIILCVGNISLRKNQNAFLQALDGMASRRAFQLVFLGSSDLSDPYNKDFFKLIEKRPWCRYEGFADRAKLKTYIAQAGLLALPSLEDNCPMVVLEAMAAGLPVAAANVGGVPDLVDDGRTGRLFNPHSLTSMEESVAKMLANSNEARQMANEAKTEALERFQPRIIARRHLDVYDEVLRSRS